MKAEETAFYPYPIVIPRFRIIKATVEKFHVIGESWIEVFNSASTETLLALGGAVDQFYIRDLDKKFCEGLTPLHTAAGTGNLLLLT